MAMKSGSGRARVHLLLTVSHLKGLSLPALGPSPRQLEQQPTGGPEVAKCICLQPSDDVSGKRLSGPWWYGILCSSDFGNTA